MRTQTALEITQMDIDEKVAAVDLLLIQKGVGMTYLPSTPFSPGEYVGYSAAVHEGQIQIITDREVVARFAFDVPSSEIEKWLDEQEAEIMAALPF